MPDVSVENFLNELKFLIDDAMWFDDDGDLLRKGEVNCAIEGDTLTVYFGQNALRRIIVQATGMSGKPPVKDIVE